MKKSELAFNIASIPIDAFMLLLAGMLSFYLRTQSVQFVGPILFKLSPRDLISASWLVIPPLILVFALFGLYNLKGTRKFFSEFVKVLVAVSLGLLLVILLFFFDRTIFPSRFIILATWGLGIILVSFGRIILKVFQGWLFSKNIGLHKLVVIRENIQTAEIIESIFKNKTYGYLVVAELDFNESLFKELDKLNKVKQIDEILLANTTITDEITLSLVEYARNNGLAFSFLPNLFNVQRNSVETSSLSGFPMISLKNTPLDGWGKVAKRCLDVCSSLICLILILPIFMLIWITIKLDSKGKAIYSAQRGGMGKSFNFYKFRTMYEHLSVGENYGGKEAEKVREELWKKNNRGGEASPFLKIKDDPRVTRVGKFLRKTKLDEIPQFWNVLIGNMSMVGPRAHVLDEVERYKNRYQRMFSIKPGVFGMAQIAQVTWPDLPFEEEIRLNTFYIENWSLGLDIKILAKMFWLLFFSKKPRGDY